MTIEANLAAILPVVMLPFSEPARSMRDILATFTSPDRPAVLSFCCRNTCMSRMRIMTMMKQMMIRMMKQMMTR